MFELFKPVELNKTYQQIEGYAKQAFNFWADVIIDTIKQYKTK